MRNDLLAQYLSKVASEPLVLGQSDCGLWQGDWLMLALEIPDPVAKFRGTYKTMEEWAVVSGRANLVDAVEDVVSAIGLKRTDDPLPGDIGVVDLPLVGQVGAIMGTRGWVVRVRMPGATEPSPGIARVYPKPKVLAAWRVV